MTSTPAGGAVAAIPLFDRVEFALRDAGFDYDLAFALATLATTAQPPAAVSVEANSTDELNTLKRDVLALVGRMRATGSLKVGYWADELESLTRGEK